MKRVMVLSLLVMLAACGREETVDVGAPPTPTPTQTATTKGEPTVAPGKGVIALRVAVRADDQAAESVSTLTCTKDEQTGTGALTDDAAAACANARENRDLLIQGPPSDRMCTEIYGGPQTARVTGSIDGEQVDQRFARNDGCAMADWDTLEPLLGAPPDQSD